MNSQWTTGLPMVASLARSFLHGFLHLLRAYVADMRADRPAVAERVLKLAVAVAPEHVGDGHGQLRAGFHRARDEGVRIVHVEVDDDWRAFERLRPEHAPLRRFVDQHDGRIADAD